MPYAVDGNCVKKESGETVKCHETHEEAMKHFRALQANVKDSAFAEFSMSIVKASYDKTSNDPRRWRAVSSDTAEDLYGERMSPELFKDFTERINNGTPVPEPFNSVICEDAWCGGMPYLSIAHYKAGTNGKNVPGTVEKVYIDGNRLKSTGILHDSDMGRAVFDSLCDDLYRKKSGDTEHLPVRISIGFLDLEHKHLATQGGQEFTFTRTALGQICPLCEQNIGGKIYMKGQLVHLALTRVPVNPRTEMVAVEKSDMAITKKDDARSIIKGLADELDEKSLAEGTLVVKADGTSTEVGSMPTPDPMFKGCYDPNTDTYDQNCLNRLLVANMVEMRKQMTPVKSNADVVEDARRKDVTDADKKAAKKEYGDVKYADPDNNKYPIDTEEHIRAAWNYIHQKKNAAKYGDNGAAIKKRILAAWKRVIGGEPPSVEKSDVILEESMSDENVEKMNLGGENVSHQTFTYSANGSTVHGDGDNTITNPLPQKAKEVEEDDETKEEDDEKEMKSLDKAYASLKSLVAKGASVDEINAAFGQIGAEVEKSYKPAPKQFDPNDMAAIIRSAVEEAVAPLKVEIATLKAGAVATKSAVQGQAPLPRSLTIKPQELMAKSQGAQPGRKLSQIEMLARKSTGLPVE